MLSLRGISGTTLNSITAGLLTFFHRSVVVPMQGSVTVQLSPHTLIIKLHVELESVSTENQLLSSGISRVQR